MTEQPYVTTCALKFVLCLFFNFLLTLWNWMDQTVIHAWTRMNTNRTHAPKNIQQSDVFKITLWTLFKYIYFKGVPFKFFSQFALKHIYAFDNTKVLQDLSMYSVNQNLNNLNFFFFFLVKERRPFLGCYLFTAFGFCKSVFQRGHFSCW